MKVLIRALPESGGGGLPLPEFFGPFFHQVIVPKKVIFYPKLTIFVGFSVIFVIIIIKITKILIKIIMAMYDYHVPQNRQQFSMSSLSPVLRYVVTALFRSNSPLRARQY